jgi:hypothetical protein
MKATLLAKSSHGEPYKVEFSATDSGLRMFCHCQAGVLHRMCKHKQAFIDGKIEMLFDPTQAVVLSEIRSWPQFNDLKKLVAVFSEQLAAIEKSKRELDAQEKAIKAELGKGLSFGFEPKP